ncbi:MAG: hypothetical protein VX014_05620 [Verrucomicrobiota bacterium]|nr:hypothetical protein [Verrucomicrobiota bacterium]
MGKFQGKILGDAELNRYSFERNAKMVPKLRAVFQETNFQPSGKDIG